MKKSRIPRLTAAQMAEVDRLMTEEYGIQLLQMMENAGRSLALLAVRRFLGKKPKQKTVFVLAGPGGNGGGALVCARRLHGWGAKVTVFITAESDAAMSPAALHQLQTLRRIGIKIKTADDLKKTKPAKLVIDGVLGYSIKGTPRGNARTMIEWASKQIAPVLSLDTPSGLDLTNGKVHNPAVQADATLTLALPKRGLFYKKAREKRGELYLADIGVSPELYAEPGLEVKVSKNLFSKGDVVRID